MGARSNSSVNGAVTHGGRDKGESHPSTDGSEKGRGAFGDIRPDDLRAFL